MDMDVEGGVFRDQVLGDLWEQLLGLELLGTGISEGRCEVVEVTHARVETELTRLDLDDLDTRALADRFVVSCGDLNLAHGERVDLLDALIFPDLTNALLIEPVNQRVASSELPGNVVAARTLLHVAAHLLVRPHLQELLLLCSQRHLQKPFCADDLGVLLVRRRPPASGKRANEGESGGNAFVTLVNFLLKRNAGMIDGEELGVLGVHEGGRVQGAGLGSEVLHRGVANWC